jgi:hypothetical protein
MSHSFSQISGCPGPPGRDSMVSRRVVPSSFWLAGGRRVAAIFDRGLPIALRRQESLPATHDSISIKCMNQSNPVPDNRKTTMRLQRIFPSISPSRCSYYLPILYFKPPCDPLPTEEAGPRACPGLNHALMRTSKNNKTNPFPCNFKRGIQIRRKFAPHSSRSPRPMGEGPGVRAFPADGQGARAQTKRPCPNGQGRKHLPLSFSGAASYPSPISPIDHNSAAMAASRSFCISFITWSAWHG